MYDIVFSFFKDAVDGEKNYTYTMFVLYPLLSTITCNIMPSYSNAASEFTGIATCVNSAARSVLHTDLHCNFKWYLHWYGTMVIARDVEEDI